MSSLFSVLECVFLKFDRMPTMCLIRAVQESHSPVTKKNKEWQEKLPIVVLKAEEIMYSKANSEVLLLLYRYYRPSPVLRRHFLVLVEREGREEKIIKRKRGKMLCP